MNTTRFKGVFNPPMLRTFIGFSVSAWLLSAAEPAPTPEQERALLKEVRVPEGFEAKIFAIPPAVNYPVFVAAAPDGTVYVSSDRNGSIDRAPNRGRVLRVRDVDGDGHADEVRQFVPNVDSPRGLVWDGDRLYLLHPPHLSAYIDRDGDGVAEEEKVLVKNIAFGFKDRPADHSSNGIELGVDGWIYCAIGDFGFMQAEGADGTRLQLRGGGVVRVRPDGSGLELYARGTRNILEACVSPTLDVFARDNTNDGDGWDIRLHHLTGLSEHGYPSLFKNFKGEFIEPLADYGGGSGCGGLFLSEPGFPAGYGEALYTADWGREWVYRHRVTPEGASFRADQSEFIRAPRVTDLDVDASSRIYLASWKGATFTYVGENVGFLVRVTPKGYQPEPLPDFRKASERELTSLLESPSHRRRLEAQRELLKRKSGDLSLIEMLARDARKPLPTRIAALYLVALQLGERSQPFLESLLGDATIEEYALRALCERGGPSDKNKLVEALQSGNPRIRREAAFGISRLGNRELAGSLTVLMGDPDATVRHTAIQALKKLDAAEVAFQVIDSPGSNELERNAAQQVLQALHEERVVDGLISRLAKKPNDHLAITALARLHYKDGEWKGDSWGTRPDTSGPYYQPAAWGESPKIAEVLKSSLKSASGEDAVFIARELGRHKVQDPEILEVMINLAERDESLRAAALAQLARADSVPKSALSLLIKGAREDDTPTVERANAVISLAREDSLQALEAMLAAMPKLQNARDAGREVQQARQAFLRARNAGRRVEKIAEQAARLNGETSTWADAMLVVLADSRNSNREGGDEARAAVDKAWQEPARRVQILQAVALSENRGSRERVLEALDDPDPSVAEAARRTARALRIERETKKPSGPQISTLSVEETLAQVSKTSGDRKLGQELFTRQSCNTCHTVSESEPLRGPFLGNIANIYKREEIATAILQPNKTIAQGFTTHHFQLKDETEVDGFVVQESASSVIVRNAAAQEIRIDLKDVATRAKLERSIMPEGLVGNLTVKEFASLLEYLTGLAPKP